MPHIPTPQRQQGKLKGINATTYGCVLKVRLSKHGLQQLREICKRLDIPQSQYMRQVIETAAEAMNNDQSTSPPDPSD